MKLQIKDILYKHKNIPSIVIGHGPHLDNIKPRLQELKNKGFILVGTNDWYCFYDVEPHHCVICNHIYSISRNYEDMNKYKTTIIYADTQELTNRKRIDDILKVDYLPYDFRHIGCNPCSPYPKWRYFWEHEHHFPDEAKTCCDHFISGRLTLQEELQKLSGHKEMCSIGITLNKQLQFSILLGCNPIYLAGFNLDYSVGYSTLIKPTRLETDTTSWKEPEMQNTYHNDFRIMNESAKLLGIKIINLNKNLRYDEFEKGDLI